MSDTAGPNRIAQRLSNVLLPDDVGEGLRAKSPRQDSVMISGTHKLASSMEYLAAL